MKTRNTLLFGALWSSALADRQFGLHYDALHAPESVYQNISYLPHPNATKSFWTHGESDANPLATAGSTGSLTPDADVCIIGAGITGVSAAYHLTRLFEESGDPVKIVVLEAREFCSGATGRNGGHLVAAQWYNFAPLEAQWGLDEARRGMYLEEHTVEAIISYLDSEEGLRAQVNLGSGGRTAFIATKEGEKDAMRNMHAAKVGGLDMEGVEWVSTETAKEKYGSTVGPAVHWRGYNVWPLKLVNVLFRSALRIASAPDSVVSLGLHTRTPVTAIVPAVSTERQWALHTPRGTVECGSVLHATNAYAGHLVPAMRGPAGIVPTRGQVLALRAAAPLERLTDSGMVWYDGDYYWFPRLPSYERAAQAGAQAVMKAPENPLVILGGGRWSAAGKEVYVTDDSVVSPEVGQTLRKFLPSVFPEMYEADREPEMEWSGIMGYTESEDPFVGPVLNTTGQYISAGYNGHGMPRAFACGEAVAGIIAADIKGERWALPSWLPKHYLTTRGVIGRMEEPNSV